MSGRKREGINNLLLKFNREVVVNTNELMDSHLMALNLLGLFRSRCLFTASVCAAQPPTNRQSHTALQKNKINRPGGNNIFVPIVCCT